MRSTAKGGEARRKRHEAAEASRGQTTILTAFRYVNFGAKAEP